MNIVGVMALHRRERVAKVCVERLQSRQKWAVDMVLVGDSEVERKMAEELGTHYVETPNYPLSMKWEAGIQKARTLSPEAVLIMGSDDWVTDDWLETAWYTLTTEKVDLVGKMEWEICLLGKTHSPVILHQEFIDGRKTRPIGAGRLFSRRILEKLNWKLWVHPQNKGLDLASFDQFKKVGGRWKLLKGNTAPRLLLLRCDWDCCNSWQKLTGGLPGISSSRPVPHPYRWMEKFYPNSMDDIRRLIG